MYFTKDHEWVSIDGEVATIGVTEYAVHQLGDVVFAETPEAGRIIAKGDAFAVVESVKAASDIYAPVAGEVIEGNDALAGNPALVNDAPEGDGWFAKVRLSNPSDVEGLMDRAAYDAFIATL